MKNTLLKLALVILLPFAMLAQEIDISKGWKFKTGDDLKRAAPKFDDKDWKSIESNRSWEFQGYNAYDGYAWYRCKVVIPSSMKQNSFLKDSLKLLLGIIDDHDQVFLNGEMIAQNAGMPFVFGNKDNTPNNSAYNKERRYAISSNHKAILWDKENVIAIRVFDQLGGGGMTSGKKYSVSMVDVVDYISIDITEKPFSFRPDGAFAKTVVLKSSGSDNLEFSGELTVDAVDNFTKKSMANYSVYGKFSAAKPFNFEFVLPGYENLIAKFTFVDEKSGNNVNELMEIPFLLTPPEKPEPKINSAKVFGVRPGSPFLFTVAASGERPMTFTAQGLPQGLSLDGNTGFITGKLDQTGEFTVKLTSSNAKGRAEKTLKIICGDLITLTPQMGWNSWNCWGLAVSDEKVRSSAKAMIEKGLMNYGWTYMNIDDGWEDKRDAKEVLLPNEKFPNMKKLADDIHAMGLKIGIYSSPGPLTCGKYEGSYKYEQIDINTWASWGIDYLKYDWCSYSDVFPVKQDNMFQVAGKNPKELAGLQKPYQVMQKAIANVTPKRDIVYSLCQYGWGAVWKWGAAVNGQSWRTTGDIEDSWASMAGIGFAQNVSSPYAKPGRWNDPDMLVVGKVGWGPRLRNSRLSINEQYTHISLWSLLASPLLIGCDMSQLDDFTLNLLKNSEVIDVNQDPLGKQAQQVLVTNEYQVWVKELEDGSKAVGLFNLSGKEQKITLNWSDIKITGSKTVRDVWRQKDLGKFDGKFETMIATHGVTFVKIF
jgi:alpha-galactosidase